MHLKSASIHLDPAFYCTPSYSCMCEWFVNAYVLLLTLEAIAANWLEKY